MRRFFRTSFGSALLGGAVVAAFGCDRDRRRLARYRRRHHDDDHGAAQQCSGRQHRKQRRHQHGQRDLPPRRAGRRLHRSDRAAPKNRPRRSTRSAKTNRAAAAIATGSGFLIDTEGHIVTNNHVVEGATKVEVKLGSSDTSHEAEVVGTDPATDVALLKVDVPADQQHPLALGNSSKVQVGDPVVAIGNPFGLDRTVTAGIVSALQRQIQAPNGFSISHVIQTDAAINPGNSGGPLIDADGRVIGINSQIQTGGGSERQRRHRLRGADQHRPRSRRADRRARRGRARLHRHQRRQHHAGAGQGAETAGRQRRPRQRSGQGQPGRQGRASKAATPKRRSKAPRSTSAATSSPRSTASRSARWKT